MSEEQNLTTGDDELVAYLDGELGDVDSGRIEQRLATDTEYRLRLAQLQRSFDLLEALPSSDVENSFTRSTVELVVLSESRSLAKTTVNRSVSRTIGWLWVAACLICVSLASYMFVTSLADRPNRQLVEDLPIIEDLDLFRYAGSIEFLQQLDSQGLFSEDQVDELQ